MLLLLDLVYKDSLGVRVLIASALAKDMNSSREFVVEAPSIKEALLTVDKKAHGFKDSVCDETEQVRPNINIFVNGLNISRREDALLTALHDGDRVHIFPSVAGGTY